MNDAALQVLRVLTVNLHKGFTFFNRRFVLHELLEAIAARGPTWCSCRMFNAHITADRRRPWQRCSPASPHGWTR